MALKVAITHYIAQTYTDSVGSAWCFYNAFTAVFFLIDYMCFDSGDEERVTTDAKVK